MNIIITVKPDPSKAVLLLRIFYVFSVLCLLYLCEFLFICALWSPAGKGLTSGLSFVVSNCKFVTFPLVSWVKYGTSLYRFLFFAPLLTFSGHSKRRSKLVFTTNYLLMQDKSIAECSKGSILHYFLPSLIYHLSLRSLFCLFLSGRLSRC